MKKIVSSIILLLIILTACQQPNSDMNYFVTLTGESEKWQLTEYELMQTSDAFKAGNGLLKSNNSDETKKVNFLSVDTFIVINDEEEKVQGYAVSGDTEVFEQDVGAIEREERRFDDFSKISEVYSIVTWNDADTNGDEEEIIQLYDRSEEKTTFLDAM